MSTTADDLKRRIAQSGVTPSADDLRARLSGKGRLQGQNAVTVGTGLAARGLVNNALAMPSASGDLLAAAAAGARGNMPQNLVAPLIDHVRGVEVDRPGFSERFAEERERFPASALRAIPRPTVTDIVAGLKSLPSLLPGGEKPGEALERNREGLEEQEFEMRAAHPTAAMAGDVSGDIASLFLARRGSGASGIARRFETRMGARGGEAAAKTLMEDLGSVLQRPAFRTMVRGAGRSLETGIEAAVLDIVKDPNADPTETAAIAAGAQLVGSGFMGSAQGLLSGGPTRAGLKVAVAAASTMGLLQLLKSATPGGRDRILESMEGGYDKVALALGLGAASAAIGLTRYGRGNTALSEQTRNFLDGLATTHRGTTLSLVSRWNDAAPEDQATIEKVLEAVAKDPFYKGANAAERSIVSSLRQKFRTGEGF